MPLKHLPPRTAAPLHTPRRRATIRALGSALLVAVGAGGSGPALADLELNTPDGRRVLLLDDGTWRHVDAAAGAAAAGPASAASAADAAMPAASAPSAPQGPKPTAELKLLRRVESPNACSFEFELVNTLPYEVRSLVPYFAVLRADGVTYSTQSGFFGPAKPGDTIRRSLRFAGIECAEIAKVQVLGGDRCEMGELNKFSDAKGECLSRVRVLPSDLVEFAR